MLVYKGGVGRKGGGTEREKQREGRKEARKEGGEGGRERGRLFACHCEGKLEGNFLAAPPHRPTSACL